MFVFLFILLGGLTLIYLNASNAFEGKKGKLIALIILLSVFLSMIFRDTFAGSIALSFFAVWLCEALSIYLLWGLFRIIRREFLRKPLDPKILKKVSRILLVLSAVLTLGIIGYGVPHNQDYKIREKKINILSGDKSFTVMYFSDIHFAPLFNKKKLQNLVNDAQKIQPDFIIFGGDLADISTHELNEQGYDSLFKQLTSAAKIAAVGINGNHEAMQEKNGSLPNLWMAKNGMIPLDDSTACFEKICITGRTDFMVARSRNVPRKSLQELAPEFLQDSILNEAKYSWLLVDHQPKGIENDYQGRLPDLGLSGHTHNGQFFPGNIVIRLVWELAYGFGELNGVPWLVSSGVDSWGPPVRAMSDTEIWVLRFQKVYKTTPLRVKTDYKN